MTSITYFPFGLITGMATGAAIGCFINGLVELGITNLLIAAVALGHLLTDRRSQ